MQASEIPNLDNIPINLLPEQLLNPLSVFEDFFSDDSLEGHLQRLKDWRDHVLKDDFYRDMKGSPAGLLYFYRLNVCLVEVAFLLKNCESMKQVAALISGQADKENVLDVFHSLFELHDLSWYRSQLYEWLEHGMSSQAAREFIETADLIFLFENLKLLYQAAWLIIELCGDADRLLQGHTAITIAKEFDKAISVYQLNPVPTERHLEKVKSVVSKIKHKLPAVQTIFDLGTTAFQPGKIFMLVLTADDEKATAQSICSMLEESCSEIADLTVLAHYHSSFLSGLSKGHTFFRSALKCPVVYLSGELLLPAIEQFAGIPDDCLNHWERWHDQAQSFFAGAEFFIGREAYEAALFCLHQCVESLLTAIIRIVLGYRINNHNLSRLLKLTELFTNGLAYAFTNDEMDLFQKLKGGYIDVRYRDNFEAEGRDVKALLAIVSRLKGKTEYVYQIHQTANTL